MPNLRNPTIRRNTPALDAWRAELKAGVRTPTTFDALWRAACLEMNALEAPTPELADSWRREAYRIVRAAQKGRVA
jgi:hypothetical protein